MVTPEIGSASWHFNVLNYDGKLLFRDAGRSGGSALMPLMWMSYAANASGGLKNVRGNPILITEAGKAGVFPEDLPSSSPAYPRDHLGRVMRFRHGDRSPLPGLVGYNYTGESTTRWKTPINSGVLSAGDRDRRYEAQTRANSGFLDGHAEALAYYQLFDANQLKSRPLYPPAINKYLWLGGRRVEEKSLSY
jgi:prepilin-type processing-associated H-X9-DG protein